MKTQTQKKKQSLVKIIKENGLIGKVIYGSDGPQFPGYTKSHLDRFLTAMKDTGYTAEEIELLLQTNFEILFKLQ